MLRKMSEIHFASGAKPGSLLSEVRGILFEFHPSSLKNHGLAYFWMG
jgi:hypothetical protein